MNTWHVHLLIVSLHPGQVMMPPLWAEAAAAVNRLGTSQTSSVRSSDWRGRHGGKTDAPQVSAAFITALTSMQRHGSAGASLYCVIFT